MKDFIKKKLHEDLSYWHADDASPEKGEFKIQSEDVFTTGQPDKWDVLEKDVSRAIMPIIDKHKDNFGHDSYAVIDAIQQVFDGMFQRVNN